MIDRHLDSIKGYSVAAYNLIAVAISYTTTIAWLQMISLSVGIIVGVVTLAEKWKSWRKGKAKLPMLLIAAAVLGSGCAAPKLSRHAVEGSRRVQEASIHVAKAKAASARAGEEVSGGRQAVAELRRTATALQQPHVQRLDLALTAVERENEVTRVSLQEVEWQLMGAQASIDVLGKRLWEAERDVMGFRRLKLWLALFAAGGAAYVALRLIPPIGPVRYYGACGVSLVVGGGIYIAL